MSDSIDNIIVDTATRIFQDLCEPATVNDAEKGVWPKALWDALEESGLPPAASIRPPYWAMLAAPWVR